MRDEDQTREALLAEIHALRARIAELEQAQAAPSPCNLCPEMFERISVAVHLYDLHPDGRLVFSGANTAADRLLGLSHTQFIGKTIEAAFPPLADTELPERYRLAAARGISWSTDFVTYADEQIRGVFQVHAFQTRPNSMAVLFLDVTQRALTEAALRDSLARLTALIDNLQQGVLFEDTARRVLYVNQAFCDLFNLPGPQAIIGADCAAAAQYAKSMFRDPEGFVQGIEARLAARETVHNEVLHLADGRVWERDYVPILLNAACHGYLWLYRDVTERMQAQETLRISLEKYRVLFEIFPLGITIGDAQGHILEVNRASERLLNLPASQHSARRIDDPAWHILRPDGTRMPPEEFAGVRALREQRLIENVEMGVVRPDDTIVWLNVNAAPIPLEGYGVAIAYNDITERLQAQRALQQERDLSQALVEAATVISRVLDPDAVLDRLLEQVSRVIPGDTMNIMLIEDDRHARVVRWRGYERFDAAAYASAAVFDLQQTTNLRQMIETGAPLVIPDTQLYPGWVQVPEVAWLRSYVGAPIIVRGVVVGFLNLDKATPNFFTPAHAATLRAFAYHAAIALENARLYQKLQQELATRAQIEAALRESEAYFRALFDQASDAIFIQDLNDNILDANRRACEMLGYTREALLHMTIPDVQAPECRGIRGQVIRSELAQYKGMPFEGIDVRSDGVRVPVEVTTSPLRIGERELAFSIVRDISERKEMEERLRRQERLAAVGQLAAGIAHDFRNLLTTIILYAQLGMRKPGIPATVLSHLDTIVGEAHKATTLVQQILDFSSRSLIERQPVDLAALIGDVFAILRRTIPENIHIALEVGAGKFIVDADPGRLQQVLTNLALNARDAMPGGGILRIGLEHLYLPPGALPPLPEMARAIEGSGGRPPNPAWICLSVADTGIGMTDSVRAHLFEPFFTTKEAGKGTGLGLAQVYGIVRQHDGYIGVDTEVGKGTTFRIYLPASATEVQEPIPETTTVPLGNGELILLVEDNAKLREAGQSMLTELGYRVLTATNGYEALTVFHAAPDIALVITDLVMPEMGGEALLQTLKRQQATCKVLAITGYTMQVGIRALKEAGFYDVIHKPFDIDTLANVIHRVLHAA